MEGGVFHGARVIRGVRGRGRGRKRGGNRMVMVGITRGHEGSRARAEERARSTCTRMNPTDFKLAVIQLPHWAIHSSRFSGQSNSVTISPPDIRVLTLRIMLR